MYLPSDTPLLTDQRTDAAKDLACSGQRIQAMRVTSATGRAALFNTLINPNAVVDNLGTGTALDVARMQQQSETARATGLLGTTATPGPGPSVYDIVRDAPEVVSLNRGGGCQGFAAARTVPLDPNPTPGMPRRAPNFVQTANGPLSFPGTESTAIDTVQYNQYRGGLTGYAPPWSDAWVTQVAQNQQGNDTGVASWISDNPWLALAIAAGGVFALSRRSKR